MRPVAINLQQAVVPHSGHGLMEESPVYTVSLVGNFLDSPAASIPIHTITDYDVGQIRLAPPSSNSPSEAIRAQEVLTRVGLEPWCSRVTRTKLASTRSCHAVPRTRRLLGIPTAMIVWQPSSQALGTSATETISTNRNCNLCLRGACTPIRETESPCRFGRRTCSGSDHGLRPFID